MFSCLIALVWIKLIAIIKRPFQKLALILEGTSLHCWPKCAPQRRSSQNRKIIFQTISKQTALMRKG